MNSFKGVPLKTFLRGGKMIYAYIRVSSTSQNVDRQLNEINKYNIPEENIFVDYQSGKDFQREQYKILKSKLKKKDLLIIKSIDRLGRNYKMITEEWAYITKTIEADINVIDMPLLNTNTSVDTLMSNFISDIVLQILSFVSENERANIKQRQKEGIAIAKQKGIHLGRPKYVKPKNFDLLADKYNRKELTINQVLSILKISRSCFYKYSK